MGILLVIIFLALSSREDNMGSACNFRIFFHSVFHGLSRLAYHSKSPSTLGTGFKAKPFLTPAISKLFPNGIISPVFCLLNSICSRSGIIRLIYPLYGRNITAR